MKDLHQIKRKLEAQKSDLFMKYPIESMAIFGSYGRNEASTTSDLDILIDIDSTIGIRFIDLAEELENITGAKVDLVSKEGVKDKYLREIERDLIYV